MAAVASQPIHAHQQQQQYYGGGGQQHHHRPQQQQMYQHHSQSIMEDASDEEHDHHMNGHGDEDDEDDDESIEGDINMMDPAHAHFYQQQQQQALYYQQHQQQHGSQTDLTNPSGSSKQNMNNQNNNGNGVGVEGDEEMYSDEESDTDSMPDENIDFSLTYALHTFLATVEGQASVVKGDSLVLLDDANSYWWLVRVLKTEDVGYIPAENIETPYERLARLNKHRNVDLAAATLLEKQAGTVQGREKLKDVIASKAKGLRRDLSGEVGADSGNGGGRRVVFAPPTYVDHPGVTWSSDEEDDDEEHEDDEGEHEVDQVENESAQQQHVQSGDVRHEAEIQRVDQSLEPDSEMEPDDGVEWADNATIEEQRRVMDQKQRQSQSQSTNTVQPKSNNPFAPRDTNSNAIAPSASNTSLASSSGGSAIMDPAQAGNETRRLTVTPAVASGPLLPSAMQAQQNGSGTARNVSGQSAQSVQSVSSVVSTGSPQRSTTPTSPEEIAKKGKKMKKGSKEELDNGEKKKRGMLGGLFHRKGKDKGGKGVAGNDARSSEESMVSGAVESGPNGQQRWSEERAAPPSSLSQQQISQQQQTQQPQPQGQQQNGPGISSHGLRLQQQDQARMQSYTSKYLNKSPSSDLHSPTAEEAAAAVAQSAAAMRLAASMGNSMANINGGNGSNANGGRPSSIILSPNPAGPPLLNVIRIFAGDHIKSESSFKTALINETTSSSDLIKQAMQRFHLTISSSSSNTMDNGYFITIRDVNGEEFELTSDEKPLIAFQEAVQRWANESDEDLTSRIGAITPTVKRSSVSSLSSVMSLSNHPAIAKLGMNDFSDDSTVKIYLNRRRPGSVQLNNTGGMPEPVSEFSSYSTQLSTVQESEGGNDSSPEDRSGEWTNDGDGDVTPPAKASQRFNNPLSIQINNNSGNVGDLYERYTSPSARFTIQLIIHQNDLPDNLSFDPSSDSIVPKSLLGERQVQPSSSSGAPRKRLFLVPRNVNVIEAIEQGLDRFGIQEGVVDGGDDVEDKIGKRRSVTRVRYNLAVIVNGEERLLSTSSRILEAYDHPPNLRPMERTTPAERRRSRDLQHTAGSPNDILPTDPVFVLRRVHTHQHQARGSTGLANAKVDFATSTPRQSTSSTNGSGDTRSPAEIIAAQRAASRANQKALISAHTNQTQGVDIILPDQKGTFRSSRLIEHDGEEVVRYSYIDGDGETYDISELLEEEWGGHSTTGSSAAQQKVKPSLNRLGTDQSAYITAPSTPEEGLEKDKVLQELPVGGRQRTNSQSQDILKATVEKGQEKSLEEKLIRVMDKVKSGSVKGSTSSEEVLAAQQQQQRTPDKERESPSPGRVTPNNGRSTPQHHPTLSSLPEGKIGDLNSTPRASNTSGFNGNGHDTSATPRSSSRNEQYSSINKLIYTGSSRHRQQPSIASIMSDLENPNPNTSASSRRHPEDGSENDEEDRSSTPVTATSSTHPTPPFNGAVFTRAVSGSISPTPRGGPVRYKDDFGMGEMMAIIGIRAREYLTSGASGASGGVKRRESDKSSSSSSNTSDDGQREREKEREVDRVLSGEKIEWDKENIHPEIKGCFDKTLKGLERFEEDLNALLAEVAGL
ncbi:hypothetical protein I302_108801 [Kwoniella bestiolae CBS 10118]|uniref:SH3 domain-containing protein n=1 Tax=Kwoniella bestiolae CBS 10118 TaxID=1296100 RepID=A0A1B9FU43_9TREE|nr:hypothetical protein I302_07938 [Kwoniella bestiolae CBS 10118]OCF22293.1 hypothetical protein I302_07938 [Kwoniella bestiolae CBS 10118]